MKSLKTKTTRAVYHPRVGYVVIRNPDFGEGVVITDIRSIRALGKWLLKVAESQSRGVK